MMKRDGIFLWLVFPMKFSETLHRNRNVLVHPFIQDGKREKKLIQEKL
jgi:hypothetical protein